jgi:V/A-type H+/Na+-transporting ATPase subunit I
MMFTTEMVQLFAVVLGRDSERVSEMLLSEGVVQFVNIREIDDKDIKNFSSVNSRFSVSELSSLRERIESILHTGGITPDSPKETDLSARAPVNIDKDKKFLDKIDGERESIRERQRAIQQEILKLEDINRQVDLYGLGLSDIPFKTRHSFLQIQTGRIPSANKTKLEDDLKDFPSLCISLRQEDEITYYLLISMKRDSEAINKILSENKWANIELPEELKSIREDVFKEISNKHLTLTEEQKKLEKKASDLITSNGKELTNIWLNLRVTELLYKIQTNFKSSSRTVVFTGWLPAFRKDKLSEKIQKSCGNRCYLEWHSPDGKEIIDNEVPVQFNNPKTLAPFEMLVSNFGIPQYKTIDPTPFVMPIYLAMFGLMFADAGQGAVLVILGILGTKYFRNIPEKKGYFKLSWLIIWCGLSSIVFGVLFGSYFGKPVFEALWFDFHGIVSGHSEGNSAVKDIMDILAITIYFGIAVIFLGLLFNWINLIRIRNWFELIFDKGGILGGWIYGGGVYIASYMVKHNYNGFPSGNVIFMLAGLPAFLLLLKEPYHYFHHKTEKGFNPLIILNFLMQWIVELLEIFSGYLANTLSFMRVAGLGIAHASLMIATFSIAEMASGVFSVIVIIFGNILVLGLEGLSAGVQALRLNYYEFFTKFFHGTGKLYTPISLNSD